MFGFIHKLFATKHFVAQKRNSILKGTKMGVGLYLATQPSVASHLK